MKFDRKKFCEFVNSRFGLWLLSTVGFGIISTGVTALNSYFRVNEENAHKAEKINDEIQFRTAQFVNELENINIETRKKSDSYTRLRLNEALTFFKSSPKTSKSTFQSLYPEYYDRNMISLLMELSDLTDDEKLTRVIKFFWRMKICPEKTNCHLQLKEFCNTFNNKFLNYEKWRKNGFYTINRLSFCR